MSRSNYDAGSYKPAAGRQPTEDSHSKFSIEFCAAVCLTFGLASYMMFSAWGRFSGVAWGNVDPAGYADEGFIAVDVSDLDREDIFPRAMVGLDVLSMDMELPVPDEQSSVRLSGQQDSGGQVSDVVEDFGPLPKYLSDYESIVLSVQDNGTKLPDEGFYELGEMELPDTEVQLAEVGVSWREHIVKSGETLSDIAMSYGGLTAQDILRANGLKDANRLSENQLLLIPANADSVEDTLDEVRTRQARIAALREKVEPLKVMAYVVMQGDSLWSISNSQNIEIDTLVGCNTFKSSAVLHPGAVLRIPNQDGIFYTLRKGEKIEDVCKRYGVDLKKLKAVNQSVDTASLKAGAEIFLPEARPEAEIHEASVKKADKGSLSAPQTRKKTVEKKQADKKVLRSYRWPVMGRINSPFGWRRHPITKRRDFHTGIDIKASRGTLIRAAREGRVAYSGWMGGYGKVAVIEHSSGQSTLYAHCSSLMVKQGSKVSQGQDIARVGTTGRTTGPHLHFEVRNGNSPVNPLEYLK